MKIGWSCKNISTTSKVIIPGQMSQRISKGISEPLYCSVLCLADNNDYVIFVSVDTTELTSITEDIRMSVSNTGKNICTDKILIFATHNHTSPYHTSKSECTFNGLPDEVPHNGVEFENPLIYRDFLIKTVTEAVCEAFENMYEGYIAYGYSFATVGHNRRVLFSDDMGLSSENNGFVANGHCVLYGNTNDKRFTGYEGGADTFVNFLYTFDTEKQLTGSIINVPCPSQCSEFESALSSDYWHEVREKIREKYGDIFILPQCAAAGDIAPKILHNFKAQDRRFNLKYNNLEFTRAQRHDIAERLQFAFSECLSWAKNDLKFDFPIKHITRKIKLQRDCISKDDYLTFKNNLVEIEKQGYKTDGGLPDVLFKKNTYLLCQKTMYETMIKRYETQADEAYRSTEIHVVKVGDIAFVSNAFELFIDYMHRIQARSPFTQTFIIQLCCETEKCGSSYLPTQKATENKGYSAIPLSNEISAKGGDELVEISLDILNQLY